MSALDEGGADGDGSTALLNLKSPTRHTGERLNDGIEIAGASGGDGGGGDDFVTLLKRKSPSPDPDTTYAQQGSLQDDGFKDGEGAVDAGGGGGNGVNGSTTPLKRKSSTPDTEMVDAEQAAPQDEACQDGGEAAFASDVHDEQGPVAKKPRLDTDTETEASNAPKELPLQKNTEKDTLNVPREPSPEKQPEPGPSTQPESHNGNDEGGPVAENLRPDTITDPDGSNAQVEPMPEIQVEAGMSGPENRREPSPEKRAEAGASNQPDNHDEESPTAEPPKPEPQKCGICDKQPGKYKCPRCPLRYCSVACNKTHKENHPPPPPPDQYPKSQPTSQAQPTSNSQSQSTDPYEVLLRHRAEFDRLMERYPGLERILFNIQKSTLPPPDDPSVNGGVPSSILQQTGGVSGFVPASHHGKGKPLQREIWSREVGLRKGVAALKKARTNPGILGDGVREFCELVVCLLNNPSLQADTGLNATSLVRQEVVADQTKVIQTLLEVEKDGDDL